MAASSDEPEVMKATRSLDNSEVHSFFFLFLVTKSYSLFMNIILCCWHVSWHLLTDMVVMLTILTILSNEAWSTCSLDSHRPIWWHKGAFSSQDPRNLWLSLVCLVNNFDLPLWSHMYRPNWSLRHGIKNKKWKWQMYAKIIHFITCSTPDL